jgi:iron complex outermembrane receptor protein
LQPIHTGRLALLVTTLLAPTGPCALAQSAAEPAASAIPQTQALETVVVTAQRRRERLQDVPIAIDAFTGRDLKAAQVIQPIDLASHVPNLTVKNAVGNTAPVFSLRGISLNDFATNGTQPVGVYVDDVYLVNNSQLGFQLMDMERVEVLKGPQGTLYGRNTTAGAVSFITNKPSQTFGAGVDFTVGDYGLLSTDAYVTGPLTPTLSARFAFSGERQFDGYFTNDLTGKNWGQSRRVAGRGELLWEQGETSVLFSLHAGIDKSDNWYYKYIADASGFPLGQQLQAGAKAGNPDIFHGQHTIQPFIDNQSTGGVISVTHNFDGFSLKSITGLEQLLYQRSEDYGSVPAPDGQNIYGGHLSQYSEELRLTSSDSGRWKWIVGAFAGHDRLNESDIYNEISNPIYQGYVFNEKYVQNTTSLAIFTSNTIELLPKLHLTLGGRFTHEERNYNGGTLVLKSDPALAFDTCPCVVNTRLNYNVPTGKAGLDYKIGNVLVYTSISDGYKAGGVTGFYVTDTGAKAPYQPEFVNAYEAGVKSDWLDGHLRLNASLFYYDYRDLQAFGVIHNEFRIFNVTKSRVQGSEIEADIIPFPGLKINSGLGLLDTRVQKSNVGGILPGYTLGNAPKIEWDNSVAYTLNLANEQKIAAVLEADFRGSTYYYVQNNPLQRQESYWLFNPRLTWSGPADHWSATVFLKNAGNRHYYREIFNDAADVIGFPAPPLTYGFTLSYRWR